MQRNMDFCRAILLKAAQCVSPFVPMCGSDFPGYPAPQFSEHAVLLEQAGLVKASLSMGGGATIRLTWSGNEFLELSRNDNVWRKTLDKLKQQGTALTFELISRELYALITNS